MDTSENFAESIFQKMRAGVILVDMNRRVQFINSSYSNLTGWDEKEARGKYCYELHESFTGTGMNICRENCLFYKALEHGEDPPYAELVINTKDELVKWVRVHHTRVNDFDGNPGGCIIEMVEIEDFAGWKPKLNGFLGIKAENKKNEKFY